MKNFNQHVFENINIELIDIKNEYDILESIITSVNTLLNSVLAEEIDIFYTFGVNPENFDKNFIIDELYESDEFNKSLDDLNLKKGSLENSKDIETFLEKTLDVRFFFIWKEKVSELNNPEFIILQTKNVDTGVFDICKGYEVKDNINNFYNKLSSKTIEIVDGENSYIYTTCNAGNDWKLEGVSKETKVFKEFLSNDEIKKVLKNKNLILNIIP